MILRAFFLLLVLGNLILFALSRGYLGNPDDGREPGRLAGQIQPDRLRVVKEPGAILTAPLPSPAKEECKPATSHWVHIPELASRAAAEKKGSELRGLGVNDFHILDGIEGGKFSISLGVFDGPEEAAEFLKNLNRKGVRSARIEARPKPDSCPG